MQNLLLSSNDSRRKFQPFLNKKCLTYVLLLSVGILIVLNLSFSDRYEQGENAKRCFFHNGKNPNASSKFISYFDDLMTSVKQPEMDTSIFFLQTHCTENAIVSMRPRHACSIEAAARLNPERSVFMIFTSPVGLPMDVNQWSPAVKVLMKYPNIHFRNVQLKELSKHSPIEKWLDTTPIFESFAMYTHISDLVRMLLLYKFGGTYLETDVLLLKNLSLIQHNWMSLQNPKCLNNGAMDFSHEGVGHEFTHDSLGEFHENYRHDLLSHNGPDLLVRVARKICNESDLLKINQTQCNGLKIFQENTFSPLSEPDWIGYIYPYNVTFVLNAMKNSMGIEVYNNASKEILFKMQRGDAYDQAAKKNCPRIYEENMFF